MDNYSGNKEYNIYRDIRNRTNGEIYLGTVSYTHLIFPYILVAFYFGLFYAKGMDSCIE